MVAEICFKNHFKAKKQELLLNLKSSQKFPSRTYQVVIGNMQSRKPKLSEPPKPLRNYSFYGEILAETLLGIFERPGIIVFCTAIKTLCDSGYKDN